MNIEQLRAQLGEFRSEMEPLATEVELTDEQQTRFTELETQARETIEKIDAYEQRQQVIADAATRSVNVERTVPQVTPVDSTDDPYDVRDEQMGRMSSSELRGRALKAVEKTNGAELDDRSKERITNLVERDQSGGIASLVLATGSRDYKEAFAKKITGRSSQMTTNERDMLARAASLADAGGGVAVPFPIDPTLIDTGAGSVNSFRQVARVETITTNSWQGVAATAITASYKAEAAEATDDTPTWSQPAVPVHRGDVFVPGSIEIQQDYRGLADDLRMLIAEAKDDLEAVKFATGTGTDEPTGVVTALTGTAAEVDAATDDVYAIADVYAVQEGLAPKHRGRAAWMMNLATINATRQFATANNYHAFLTELSGDTPRQLLGRPLYEASGVDGTIDGAADNFLAVLGNWSRFLIAERAGTTIEYIPHLFGANNRPTGQRGWFAYFRNGSDVIDVNAFSMLKV